MHDDERWAGLFALATAQPGAATIPQAVELGLPVSTVNRWARAGRLRRLAQGAIALPEAADEWVEYAGACLVLPDATMSHRAAPDGGDSMQSAGPPRRTNPP